MPLQKEHHHVHHALQEHIHQLEPQVVKNVVKVILVKKNHHNALNALLELIHQLLEPLLAKIVQQELIL